MAENQSTIFSFDTELQYLRQQARDTTYIELLNSTAPEELLDAIDRLVKATAREVPVTFGYILGPRLCAECISPNGVSLWDSVCRYCESRFGKGFATGYPDRLLEILAYLFNIPGIKFQVGRNIVRKLQTISFDKDDLVSKEHGQDFLKEGILSPPHWLLYDQNLPGQFVSNGFASELLETMHKCESNIRSFGMAVCPDIILASDAHLTAFTKAYVRGPRELSPKTLNNQNFPPDPSGTITEHVRYDNNPLLAPFPLERTEIMWSSRDGIKTVQIEEILPLSTARNGSVMTRYLHAQWDPVHGHFLHLDGAIKTYSLDVYQERLRTDIKKFESKADGYRKLFRIDADLNLQTWGMLASKFFENNELVVEYLEQTFGKTAEL